MNVFGKTRLVGVMLAIAAVPFTYSTVSASAVSYTADSESAQSISVQEEILKYTKVDENAHEIEFDVERAVAEGASEHVIESGKLLNDYAEMENSGSFRSAQGLPIYGNWCGPGHSGPGEPIDDLDRACMNHDKCYASKGYTTCSCDEDLLAEIRRIYDGISDKDKVAADAITTFFKLQRAWCKK